MIIFIILVEIDYMAYSMILKFKYIVIIIFFFLKSILLLFLFHANYIYL